MDDHKILQFEGSSGVQDVIRRKVVDLVILDIMLPDGNGFGLSKSIREISDIPIIFLTAKDSESDRILGFEVGADDYVVKPFSSKELALRVQALLKRYRQSKAALEGMTAWTLGPDSMELELPTHRLRINGREVRLTGAEWKILVFLADREQLVVSRERILADCLNYFFEGSERTVDTHIANLRTKLGESDWIGTVRGYGYRFNGIRGKGNA